MTVIESQQSQTTPASGVAPHLGHLGLLEAESIYILREVASEFAKPVMLYSIGKDSSVMLRLAQKAFYPGPIPFPLLHIDTGFKFDEMLTFRDAMARSIGAELLVWRNEAAIAAGTNPIALDTKRCCGLLKTQALLDALNHYGFDAAFGGARRDEEKSRAKERIYSFRDAAGQWDPKNQRPELWNLYNARIHPGESIRVFPLSNWTEMDVWQYIHEEKIPVVDLYFAKKRPMYVRGAALLPVERDFVARPGERPQMVKSRLRSLGCSPCTGAIRSDADSVPAIIAELISFRSSERANRVIDHDQEGSMELEAGGLFLVAASVLLEGSTFSIDDFLAEERSKDLLRFSTAGSVDDGKSTLIGRLLYDTQSVYDDQVRSIEGKGTTAPRQIDFALLTDGLRAEREQGITIDVAYRYFSTSRRKFIIADTPGHEQYTRNMATGASTADAAVVLIDARKGVLAQSRRHAYIASLLGVRHILVAVNKMDLVGYGEHPFREIEHDFHDLLKRISADTGNPVEAVFIPVSALLGDNVARDSEAMPWYSGRSLLELLESLPSAAVKQTAPFRFPVQRVLRPDSGFRGFSGQISSGTLRTGDSVTVLPSGLRANVTRIVTFDGDITQAQAPLSVTLALDREIDISRGDLLISDQAPATLSTRCKASLVWMDQRPLEQNRRYLLKHTSQTIPAIVTALDYRTNINSIEHEAAETLEMNSIGVAALQLMRPIALDRYAENRTTGAFILIDPETNGTVAAGMVTEVQTAGTIEEVDPSAPEPVSPEERASRWGHRGGILKLRGPIELIDRIERSLFAANTVTIRCSTQEQAKFAAASGLIALLAKPSHDGLLTAQVADADLRVDGDDSDRAIAAVHQLLATAGILTALQKSGSQ